MVQIFAKFGMPFFMGLTPPFPDLEGSSLLTLCRKGIVARIATIPAKFIGTFNGQLKSIVVVAFHQNNAGSENQQLCYLGWRSRFWSEDHGFLSHSSRHPGESGARVPSRSGDDCLRTNFMGTCHHNRGSAVLERSRRVF